MRHLPLLELEMGLLAIGSSPTDRGLIDLIVRRPAVNQREVLDRASLDPRAGLVGDSWAVRPSSRTPDRSPHPEMQLNIMNARVATLLAGPFTEAGLPDRRVLAGDQLFVDLDLSEENLPVGTRLRLGNAVIEVTGQPHLGCVKFAGRFGGDALRLVNSPRGRARRLRGLNARVVVAGGVRRGDLVSKLADGKVADGAGTDGAGIHQQFSTRSS